MLTTACARSSPTEPAPPQKSIPNISVSVVATAEALSSGGHTYRVIVKLIESGGAAATISSIDLTFVDGSTTLAASHHEQPISETTNVVPPNATLDSRELMTTDEDFTHPAATSVVAKVAFTDGSTTASASGSAEVPAPPPAAYTLSGTVVDESSGRPISAGTVQIVDGPNAGKTSSVDAGGTYTLPGLAGGSFMVRATANRYSPREQSVTIARDTTLDLTLRPVPSAPPSPPPPPPPSSCSYTVAPIESGTDYRGGSLTATISRTSGNCSWQAASDVSWITFTSAATGNGSATLAYTVAGNGTLFSRFGNITISWGSGSARIRVTQGHPPDWLCSPLSVVKGPQDFGNVPSAGGQLTVSASILSSPPGVPYCGNVTVSSNVPWITGGGTSGPPGGTFTFSVAPNPSPGTARSGSIVATGGGKTETLAVTQR